MDVTPTFFDMVPERIVSEKGIQKVRVLSSGAQKKKLAVALSDGGMLPASAIFKEKKNLKFQTPENVHVTQQKKGWMDSELMVQWLRGIVLPYTHTEKRIEGSVCN